MTTEQYNVLAFWISIGAIFISVFGIFISVVLKTKSDQIAIDANNKADKALSMSQFAHMVNILPILIGKCYGKVNPFIFFLINRSHGKAVIERLGMFEVLLTKPEGAEIEYPFTLGFNGDSVFKIVIPFEQPENQPNYFRDIMESNQMVVVFADEIGTRYKVILQYRPASQEWVGEPWELVEQIN